MVNIELTDAIAAALTAQAAAQGLTLQGYLESLAWASSSAPSARPSWNEVESMLDAETTTGPSPTGTFSRAEIYSDHD